MDSSSSQWSSLPSDLLRKIACCLDTRLDVVRFCGVCPSWRSTVPLPPTSLKLPFPITHGSDLNIPDPSSHFILTESSVYSIEPHADAQSSSSTSTRPWFMRIQFSESGNVLFKNLLYEAPLADGDKRRLPRALDLADYRIKELSNGYRLKLVEQGKRPGSSSPEVSTGVTQVAVSSNFIKIGDGFMVMVLKDDGKLAVWRLGDDKWTNIDDTLEGSPYSSIVYHRENFYAVDDDRLTVKIDPVSLNIQEVAPVKDRSLGNKYLVESSGDLLMVEKSWVDVYYGSDYEDELNLEVAVEIERLDEENHKWVQLKEGLKDFLMFMCQDWSLLALAKDFPGYKGNCIYYVDFSSSEPHCYHPGSGIVVFDVEYDNVRPLCNDYRCSNLFWPPPSWLKKNPKRSSKRI